MSEESDATSNYISMDCLATNIREPDTVLNLNPSQWLLPETKDYIQGGDKKDKPASDTENEQQLEGKLPRVLSRILNSFLLAVARQPTKKIQ